VEILLQRSVNADVATPGGITPLGQAIHRGHVDIVRLLLAARAKTSNLPDVKGSTILHHALASTACAEILDIFLKRGVDINATDSNGATALVHAVKVSNDDAVRVLIDLGARQDLINNNSRTTLFYAVNLGNRDFAQELLKNHTDANKESSPRNLLCIAVTKGDKEIIELLL